MSIEGVDNYYAIALTVLFVDERSAGDNLNLNQSLLNSYGDVALFSSDALQLSKTRIDASTITGTSLGGFLANNAQLVSTNDVTLYGANIDLIATQVHSENVDLSSAGYINQKTTVDSTCIDPGLA